MLGREENVRQNESTSKRGQKLCGMDHKSFTALDLAFISSSLGSAVVCGLELASVLE